MEDPDDYLLIGKLVKAHGIKGEVKFKPYADDVSNIPHYEAMLLRKPASDEGLLCEVSHWRLAGRQAILKFEGVDTCNDAEALVGHEVWVDKTALPPLAEDEFYWHEFEGLRVVTDAGRDLGTIAALMAAGPYDVLVVRGRGHEYLIPARNEFIVGREGDTLIVSPPDGLLEMNK